MPVLVRAPFPGFHGNHAPVGQRRQVSMETTFCVRGGALRERGDLAGARAAVEAPAELVHWLRWLADVKRRLDPSARAESHHVAAARAHAREHSGSRFALDLKRVEPRQSTPNHELALGIGQHG